MPKGTRYALGFFLAVLWPAALLPGAQENPSDALSSEKISSPAVRGANPTVSEALQTAQGEVRDPFSMVLPPEPEAPSQEAAPAPVLPPEIKVELQGIGLGSKDAYAVIGGEVFYQGDEKKGIKLLEVRRREVDIEVSGAKVTIPLFPEEDLQRAKDRARMKNPAKNARTDRKI